MQLMLAYRFLRKISDWTMDGFYSEVYVTGQENVPREGPVILAATHHNEIIDIAALSVTIPYRRRICYWAKSTMFKNPIVGALLRSSGSIPVHRNLNNIRNNGNGSTSSASTSQAELFRHTSAALGKGEVVGVFPEGTSYTEPGIAQVKEGAAWAAVEYVKAVQSMSQEEAGKDLLIVPAAIVYTDKSRYQSRVYVRYGKPIHVVQFLDGLRLEDDESVRVAVKAISGEILQRLKEMTINAPDWDTFNGAHMARELACRASVGLDKYVHVKQSFVDCLSEDDLEIRSTKATLVKYLALLHYTGITHAALDYLYPLPLTITPTIPRVSSAAFTFLSQLCKTVLHPSSVIFAPVYIIHLPAYITGSLAARLLTKRDEEETKAQFKAIFGGLGLCVSYPIFLRTLVRWLGSSSTTLGSESLVALGQYLAEKEGGVTGVLRRLIELVALSVAGPFVLWRWHKLPIRGNLERWRRLSASIRVLAGLISPSCLDVPESRHELYSRPPPPANNPFITRRELTSPIPVGDGPSSTTAASAGSGRPPPVSSARLVRPLLAARLDAVVAVRKLGLIEDPTGRLIAVSKRN